MSVYPYPVGLITLPPGGPTPPPVGGYSLWLDPRRFGSLWRDLARTQPAADGDSVASWFDPTASLAAECSVLAQRPLRFGDALEFDGLDDSLEVATGLGLEAGGGTVLIRGSIDAVTGALYQFSSQDPGTSGSGPGMIRFGNILYGRAAGGTADIVVANDTSNAERVLLYRYGVNTHSLWINGASVGAQSGFGSIPTQARLLLGMWYGSSSPLLGTIARVVVYPFTLTDVEATAVSTWAAA